MIESLQNEKVKNWSHLKEKKYREKVGLFLVEDDHLVKEALKENRVKEIISLKEEEVNVPNYVVSESVMKKITNQVTPPKICAVCFIKEEKINQEKPLLLLEDIQDPGNLGAIIRSATAFSFGGIITSLHTVDFYNPKTIRATEGMLFKMPVIRTDLDTEIKYLKEQGYQVYDTNVVGGVPLKELKERKKVAVVVGNEGAGVSNKIHSLCDGSLYIPMSQACESLNAAMAASIIMYEVKR